MFFVARCCSRTNDRNERIANKAERESGIMKHIVVGFMCLSMVLLCSGDTFAAEKNEYYAVYEKVKPNEEAIREITYEQFNKLMFNEKAHFMLLDVLDEESYKKGHIRGAFSLPQYNINRQTAADLLGEDAEVIVYCASFECQASTKAAKKLQAYGYKVMDYKGGLQEWQEKGNELVSEE